MFEARVYGAEWGGEMRGRGRRMLAEWGGGKVKGGEEGEMEGKPRGGGEMIERGRWMPT